MTITVFSNDADGMSAADAVADPKRIWVTPGNKGRIIVFSEEHYVDESKPASEIVVSRFQLIRALAMAGKAGATVTAIAGMSVARQTLWAEANEFRRSDKIINALKLGLAGVNDKVMDDIFIAASTLDPANI